jgi:hypothetical protein
LAWWKKALLILIGIVTWGFGLFVVGGWGYAGEFFWCSLSAIAIGFAVAPFWRHRRSIWYWPTVVILIVINLAVMYVERRHIFLDDLPSKGIVQGLVVLDCMACWGLMVGTAYLFDRRFPWDEKPNR